VGNSGAISPGGCWEELRVLVAIGWRNACQRRIPARIFFITSTRPIDGSGGTAIPLARIVRVSSEGVHLSGCQYRDCTLTRYDSNRHDGHEAKSQNGADRHLGQDCRSP